MEFAEFFIHLQHGFLRRDITDECYNKIARHEIFFVEIYKVLSRKVIDGAFHTFHRIRIREITVEILAKNTRRKVIAFIEITKQSIVALFLETLYFIFRESGIENSIGSDVEYFVKMFL